MMSQFKQLKEEIASGLKTVRQSIAQVERIPLRAQADISHRLPARGCETATAGRQPGRRGIAPSPITGRSTTSGARNGPARRPAPRWSRPRWNPYCNAEDVGSHGCTQTSPRPDAPFQTETLLSGSGLGDHAEATQPGTFLPEVLSFDDGRITDARRFIDNGSIPIPSTICPRPAETRRARPTGYAANCTRGGWRRPATA